MLVSDYKYMYKHFGELLQDIQKRLFIAGTLWYPQKKSNLIQILFLIRNPQIVISDSWFSYMLNPRVC